MHQMQTLQELGEAQHKPDQAFGRIRRRRVYELCGVSTKHPPKYLAWRRTFAEYQEKPTPEIYLIAALGQQLINTF